MLRAGLLACAVVSSCYADVRVAVLDFGSSISAPWLGAAVSEAIAVKLGNLRGVTVVDRVKAWEMPATLGKENLTPAALGVEYLIEGSAELIGKWPDKSAQVRLTARIVPAATEKARGKSDFDVVGTVGELFALESRLAEEAALALGREPQTLEMEYHEERTHSAKQLFGEGLSLLNEVAWALGAKADSATLTREARDRAASFLRGAIDKFRGAQQANTGRFFSRAHYYESQARELLALIQENDKETRRIREETVDRFRPDAAESAPASYDLGSALQKRGEYAEAIEAYDNYILWADETARSFRWERAVKPTLVVTEEAPGYFDYGKRRYDQDYTGNSKPSDMSRPWAVDGNEIFFFSEDNRVVCLDLMSGVQRWALPAPSDVGAYCLVARESRVYAANPEEVRVIERVTGAELCRFNTHAGTTKKSEADTEEPFRLFVFEDLDCVVVQRDSGWRSGHRIATGECLWRTRGTRAARYSGAMLGDCLYETFGDNYLYVLNAVTGKRDLALTAGTPIAQLWPGQDHLLLRMTQSPLSGDGDEFVRYYPATRQPAPCTERIFFSYIHNKVVEPLDAAVIPLVDTASGLYRLAPARLLLPLTVTPMMDNRDGAYLPRMALPWVALEGKHLWIWSRRTLRQVDVGTGKLRWRKFAPDSVSGVGAQWDLAVARLTGPYRADDAMAGHHIGVYLAGVSADAARCAHAYVRRAECLEALGRRNDAATSLQVALDRNANDVEVNLGIARLAWKMGNLNEALQHYERTLRFAPGVSAAAHEARERLRKEMGLLAHFRVNSPHAMEFAGSRLLIGHGNDDARAIGLCRLPERRLEPDFVRDAGYWAVDENRIIGLRPGKLYPRRASESRHGKRPDAEKDETANLEKQADSESVVYEKDLETGAERKVCRFYGMDNRFYDPSPFLLHEGALVYGVKGKELVAMDTADGRELWRFPALGQVALGAAEGRLIIAEVAANSAPMHLAQCLDIKTGELIWESDLRVALRPGLMAAPDMKNRWEPNETFPETDRAAMGFVAGDLYLTYSFARPWLALPDPRHPLFRLAMRTGKLVGLCEMDDKYYRQKWSWSDDNFGVGMMFDEHFLRQGDSATDFRVTVADFWETHPARLSRFPPLRPYKDNYDLNVHAAALNDIIINPKKRKAFIKKWREWILKFEPRYEPVLSRTQHYLRQENLTEWEEKFVARQIMTLWRGNEPHVDIRAFRYPAMVRLDNAVPVEDAHESGRRWVVGSFDGKTLVAQHDAGYQTLSPHERIARLGEGAIELLRQRGPYLAYYKADGFVYVFDWFRLDEYLTKTVQKEKGLFAVAEKPLDFHDLFDGDMATGVSHPGGDETLAVGLDYGLPRFVNVMRFAPLEGYPEGVLGVVLQGSDVSETAGFRDLATINNSARVGALNTIRLPCPVFHRYFRVVFPLGQESALTELRLRFEAPQPKPVELFGEIEPGLRCRYFEGEWIEMPDFDKLETAQENAVGNFDGSIARRNNNYGIVFSGYLKVTMEGQYTFWADCDDGSELTIGGERVVYNDRIKGLHNKPGRVALKTGLYPIRLAFYRKNGERRLDVMYMGPDMKRREAIPAEMLFRAR